MLLRPQLDESGVLDVRSSYRLAKELIRNGADSFIVQEIEVHERTMKDREIQIASSGVHANQACRRRSTDSSGLATSVDLLTSSPLSVPHLSRPLSHVLLSPSSKKLRGWKDGISRLK